MDFKMFCGKQCAWYNHDAKRCWMLEEISELTAAGGRLTISVNANNKVIDGVASSLLSLIKEKRNDTTR